MSKFHRPMCVCRKCGRTITARAVGNDWSMACYPLRHKNEAGKNCDGSMYEVSKLIDLTPK